MAQLQRRVSWTEMTKWYDQMADAPSFGPERRLLINRSWTATVAVALILLIGLTINRHPVFTLLETCDLIALFFAVNFLVRLLKDRSRATPLWSLLVVTPLVALLLPAAETVTGLWLIFPLLELIIIFCFSARFALIQILVLAACVLLYPPLAESATLWQGFALGGFLLIFGYTLGGVRDREMLLLTKVQRQSNEADAFSAVSWSLTSLTPTADDWQAIVERATGPDMSLGLYHFLDDQRTLVCDAATGEECEALRRWRYVIGPESSSMVAVALRYGRALTASLLEDTAEYLLAGALPTTNRPLRSAAVIPIQRQGGAPQGVLLALSAQADVLATSQRLGMLPAFAHQVATARENARLFAAAQDRADHDAMTGLLHHRAIHLRLNEEVARASRSGAPLCVLLIDLDRFKLFNETYGHQVGDRIILRVTELLRNLSRPMDVLGRNGGDDFLVILPETSDAEAELVARVLLDAVAADVFRPREDAETMPLTLSIGLATYPSDGPTALDLMAHAEIAMHDAKHNGGNRCEGSHRVETLGRDADHLVDSRAFSALEALVTAVDHKDRYTRVHSEEVATYAQLLARRVGLADDRVALLWDAGLLHDVGKVGVPDNVLRKPGKLNDQEYEAMKQHVVLSDALLRCLLPSGTDEDIFVAVRNHHERWDGRGYPRGLRGEDVPLVGRIMIVADAASAMHMDRPYRKGLSPEQIIGELRRGAGKQFDARLVEPFIAAFLDYYRLREDAAAETALPVALVARVTDGRVLTTPDTTAA